MEVFEAMLAPFLSAVRSVGGEMDRQEEKERGDMAVAEGGAPSTAPAMDVGGTSDARALVEGAPLPPARIRTRSSGAWGRRHDARPRRAAPASPAPCSVRHDHRHVVVPAWLSTRWLSRMLLWRSSHRHRCHCVHDLRNRSIAGLVRQPWFSYRHGLITCVD